MKAGAEFIEGIGTTSVVVRTYPQFKPGSALSTEDYYVLSRCDGKSSIRDIALMMGWAAEKTYGILRKLRAEGALLLPGEDAPPRPSPLRPPPKVESHAAGDALSQFKESDLTAEEKKMMQEPAALSREEKLRLLAMTRRVENGTYFDLLEVTEVATDRRALKRNYFRLSKEFHPDRYFGRDVGVFAPLLAKVFEGLSKGFATIEDDRERFSYIAKMRGDSQKNDPMVAAPNIRAELLFEQACELELRQEYTAALERFAEVIQADPKPKYLRRAARCAVSGKALSLALEYAKNAVMLRSYEPSYQRVLADVYRAMEDFTKAEEILTKALNLKTENDVLMGELMNDLEAVRKAKAK